MNPKNISLNSQALEEDSEIATTIDETIMENYILSLLLKDQILKSSHNRQFINEES